MNRIAHQKKDVSNRPRANTGVSKTIHPINPKALDFQEGRIELSIIHPSARMVAEESEKKGGKDKNVRQPDERWDRTQNRMHHYLPKPMNSDEIVELSILSELQHTIKKQYSILRLNAEQSKGLRCEVESGGSTISKLPVKCCANVGSISSHIKNLHKTPNCFSRITRLQTWDLYAGRGMKIARGALTLS